MTNWQPQQFGQDSEADGALREKVVKISRVAKVVKGGRHLRFNALVVVGDGQGRVGIGLGKAVSVPDAVRKGRTIAQRNLETVLLEGTTIPHAVIAKHGAAIILVKPAPAGTGIIAGSSARAVLEQAGVKDVVTKSLKSQNPVNVVQATMKALLALRDPKEELARRKGLSTADVQEDEAK
ncbi:MAG: 30S ribosomal protein S5 [Chloroflexi bacterium]|nr:30S ribosomal protein S5 [Chloroflexota bacterium]